MSDQAILQASQAITTNIAALTQALKAAFVGQASAGTFTMAASATKTVTNPNVLASSFVLPFALNAAAATLMGSTKALYTVAGGGSFTAATASGGSAAGTEQFGYLVLNIA